MTCTFRALLTPGNNETFGSGQIQVYLRFYSRNLVYVDDFVRESFLVCRFSGVRIAILNSARSRIVLNQRATCQLDNVCLAVVPREL